jgi:hypothetical protein
VVPPGREQRDLFERIEARCVLAMERRFVSWLKEKAGAPFDRLRIESRL